MKMSDNSDTLSKVQGQMNLLERIAAFVPGFHGYKEKEIRRESDRLIRNHLYMKLEVERTYLKDLEQKLADRRYFDVLTDMDRLVAKMDRVVEKVNHAPYGYSGFFDAVKVKEENLDNMIAFDNKLLDGINVLAVNEAALLKVYIEILGGVTAHLLGSIKLRG